MPGAGLGRLALWWHLRTRHGLDHALPVIPAGQTPGMVLYVSPDAIRAEAQILRRLSQADPGLRIIRIPGPDGDDVGLDAQGAAQVLDRAHAAAVLLIGSSLPPALIAAPMTAILTRLPQPIERATWSTNASDSRNSTSARPSATRWLSASFRILFFRDDFDVQVETRGRGSEIHVRSMSRTGRSDLGTNRRRVDAFLECLDT